MNEETLLYRDSTALLQKLLTLRASILQGSQARLLKWEQGIETDFLPSAQNLAHYLELRKHDLRALQSALAFWGFSSLGRTESRVLPNLDATIASIAALANADGLFLRPDLKTFNAGSERIRKQKRLVFGSDKSSRSVRIMVTMPTEAATDSAFVEQLLTYDINVARINCAHDDPEVWKSMIDTIRKASLKMDKPCRILMDLSGPKLRTKAVNLKGKLVLGDTFYLGIHQDQWIPEYVSFEFVEILKDLKQGHRVFFDDGQIETVVEQELGKGEFDNAVKLRVTHVAPKGKSLKKDKGINFPDIDLKLASLSPKDLEDLDFAVKHSDMVGYSFVQHPGDISLLQHEMALRLNNKPLLPLVLKIETRLAVENLPNLIVAAAMKQPLAVMIARGDLAVELGYERLAEMQEEILWLCEAAHVPVIWATQVLESLAKKGIPSRAEITDAAMAERAECVMLNKGPFMLETVALLDNVLRRMQEHQNKKTPRLRALRSWVHTV